MTTAATSYGAMFAPGARLMVSLADGLLKDVTPEMFARKPEGVDCNTPAFCLGHLAIYPEMILEMLGEGDKAQDAERYKELFDHGKECEDDADASKYPPMDEVLERFKSRHEAAISAIERASDETLAKENPSEGMRDRFPTVGGMCGFLLSAHVSFHLGQMSTWRRCMGLGSAM